MILAATDGPLFGLTIAAVLGLGLGIGLVVGAVLARMVKHYLERDEDGPSG